MTAGGLCTKAAATTKISGKSYTCTKVLSGKLVWVATTAAGAKPQISGGARGDGGGINDDGVRKGTHASKTIHTTPEAEGADD